MQQRLKTATAEFAEGQLVPGLPVHIDNLSGDPARVRPGARRPGKPVPRCHQRAACRSRTLRRSWLSSSKAGSTLLSWSGVGAS